MALQVQGQSYVAAAREFQKHGKDSGNVGWYGCQDITLKIANKYVLARCQSNVTVWGSHRQDGNFVGFGFSSGRFDRV